MPLFFATPAHAAVGWTEVTCSNGTFQVGWDNSNQFFADKGNIAALYCDIIHHAEYISDTLTDPSFRYYNGVIPEIVIVAPTPEPAATEEVIRPVEPTPEPTPAAPEPTPTPVEPSPEPITPTPSPEPPTPVIEPAPIPVPEPVVTPEPAPEPAPEPPTNTPSPVVVEPVPPVVEPEAPTVEPVVEPEPAAAEIMAQLAAEAKADDPVLPEALAAIPLLGDAAGAVLDAFNALGNVGADMTPEVRAKSEQVVVASVIVGQIATAASSAAVSAASVRRNK